MINSRYSFGTDDCLLLYLGLCLEKEMATHSSILAWRIPWTEELGGLQYTGRKESNTTEWLQFQQTARWSQSRIRLFTVGYHGFKGLPGGSDGKESAYNAGDLSAIPGSWRFPWRKAWRPTPVSLPGESHGQRSVVGYSPWGHRVRYDWVTNTHTQTHRHIMFPILFLFKGGIVGCINCGSPPKYSVSLKACFFIFWTVQRDTILQTTSCLILVSLAS